MACHVLHKVLLLLVLTVAFSEELSNSGLGDRFEEQIRELLRQRLEETEDEKPIFNEVPPPPHPEENLLWQGPQNMGQIPGVTVDPTGKPVIFHRGDRVWDENTFNDLFEFQQKSLGPIPQDTILTLHPDTGAILEGWGRNIFYMPHGIHIDMYGNVWVTDVALHQVFKFQKGTMNPTLVLGQRFEPGSDLVHFCQPTSVVVAWTGEIIVADGYCNNRIMIFDAAGGLLEVIPQPREFMSLQVPHGVTLLPELDVVCIADRENMRVICPNLGLRGSRIRRPPLTIQQPDLGKVYAVASYGNYVYAVNGPTSPMIPIRGFTLDPSSESIIDHWSPVSGKFTKPHGMAVNQNGTALYITEIDANRVWKFDLIRGDLLK